MAHGQPDFGAQAAKVTVGSLADMAELAARLGSIVTLDRRGDVIFLEDFESPVFLWTGTGPGAGEIHRLYPGTAVMGSQCLYLETGATAGDYSAVIRRFPVTPKQRYGVEARIQRVGIAAYYDIELWIYDGVNYHSAEWRYDRVNNRLLFLNSDGNFEEKAAGIGLPSTYNEFWPSKLVIDSETMRYVRGLFAGVEYDLSGESMYEDLSGVRPSVHISLEINTPVNFAAGVFFDNVILTQNEP